jgi:hypothetical protein
MLDRPGTVALMLGENLEAIDGGHTFVLKTPPAVGKWCKGQCCRSERFYDQPAVGFSSGAMIGSEYILTAGHCVPLSKHNTPSHPGSACGGEIRIVFGFDMVAAGVLRREFAAKDVYRCAAIIGGEYDSNTGADWLPREFWLTRAESAKHSGRQAGH